MLTFPLWLRRRLFHLLGLTVNAALALLRAALLLPTWLLRNPRTTC